MGNNPIAVQSLYAGGKFAALNVAALTGAGLAGIKTGVGRIVRIIPIVLGTTNPLTLNDLAVNTGAAAANELWSAPVASLVAGIPVLVDIPFTNGLIISAFPTGGLYVLTYN